MITYCAGFVKRVRGIFFAYILIEKVDIGTQDSPVLKSFDSENNCNFIHPHPYPSPLKGEGKISFKLPFSLILSISPNRKDAETSSG